MKTSLFFLLIILLPFRSWSTRWTDPNFDEAVKQAGLICTGVVETSTPKKTVIRIITLFKGSGRAGDLVTIMRAAVIGVGHRDDKLIKGERFLFIVKRYQKDYIAFTDSYWNFAIDDSLVSIPIRDPSAYISINRKQFETFLRLIINNATVLKAKPFIDERLREISLQEPLAKKAEDVNKQIFILETISYFGSINAVSKIIKFINTPYYQVRWSCVRALTTCGGTESKMAILALLKKEQSDLVQSVIGKAIFDLNITEAKQTLELQIPNVSIQGLSLSSDIMSVTDNSLPPARFSYGAALMKISGVKGSYKELVSKSSRYIADNPNIKLNILENKKIYNSIEDAMNNPDSVFILYLDRNELKELPAEIKNFKNLKSLSLWRTKLTDLPPFLKDLGLIKLDINDNSLTKIPDVVYECNSLEDLNMGGNPFTMLDRRISKLTNLKKLNLRMVQLDSLPDELAELKHLDEIDLYGNKFYTFPEVLTRTTSLRTILIGSNSIKRLPDNFSQMENLKYIDASYNDLSLHERANISHLPARIIINTEGYADRCYSIYEAIRNPKDAVIIHDRHNDYSNINIDFSILKETEYLVFDFNNLNVFPKSVTSLVNLKSLIFDHNNLEEVPENIGNMKSLNHLDLSFNKLKTLPASIKDLPLEYLILNNNNFSDNDKKLIEGWFSNRKCSVVW